MLTQYSHRRSLAKNFMFESSYNWGTVQDMFSGYLREESAQIASSFGRWLEVGQVWKLILEPVVHKMLLTIAFCFYCIVGIKSKLTTVPTERCLLNFGSSCYLDEVCSGSDLDHWLEQPTVSSTSPLA